jgi:signal transduction histidine kinase
MRRTRPLSLRARLVLASAYVLTAVLVAIEVPFALSVQGRAIEELQSVEVGYASLLAAQVSDPVARSVAPGADPRTDPALIADAVARVRAQLPAARVLVIDANRRVLNDTPEGIPAGTPIELAERPELASALRGEIASDERFSDTAGEDLLLVAVPIFNGPTAVGAVRISQTLAQVRRDVRGAWLGLAGVGVAALVIGLVLAWLLAAALARPVRRLEVVAARFGAGALDARAERAGPAEVAALAESFNRMADRVTANLNAQQDFVANASHQLRTPLTGLRLRLEAIEAEGGETGEQAAKAQAEVERLTRLVHDLLALARASSVETTGARMDLAEAADQAVDRWIAPAARGDRQVTAEAPEPVPVFADPGDVAHVLDNLIENALKYTPAGSRVTVRAATVDGRGTVTVTDDGPGIPAEDRERVFERFYRGTTGRASAAGTGLGLAIVAQIAGRWGAEVRLAPVPGGERGTRVEVVFPDGFTGP